MKAMMAWMAKNHVAANILLFMIMAGGIMTAPNIDQEVFPEVELDIVSATVIYPGAGPSEVEEALCVPMEQATFNLDDIEEMTCIAQEGVALLTLMLEEGVDLDTSLQEVRNAIEAITDFPEGAENPQVIKFTRQRQILAVMLAGELQEEELFDLARRIEDEALALDEVSKIELEGIKETEIVIEIRPDILSHHGLTLEMVAASIRQASLDLPAGSVSTDTGEILLRSVAKKENPEAFKQVVIKTKKTGQTLRLGDIALIEERVAEAEDFLRYDGKQAVYLKIFQKSGFTPREVSDRLKAYMEEKKLTLPEGVELEIWSDYSEVFNDRFDLLIKNAVIGLILVFLVLSLLLEIRLAFWVMLGLPISFVGSLLILPALGVSINMLSLFAFILVLGIVVDDAIVIGENVYQKIEEGMGRLEAAIKGSIEMAPPVIFAILTTLVAFSPLLFIQGRMGRFLTAIPIVVMAVLIFSLVEALFILPAHLSKEPSGKKKGVLYWLEHSREHVDDWIKRFTLGPFTNTLKLALEYRYTTLSIGLVSLIMSIALVMSGFLPVKFFPHIESDEVTLIVELPTGYPRVKSEAILKEIESIGRSTLTKIDLEKGEGKDSFLHHYTRFQSQSRSASSEATIRFRLKDAKERSISSFEFGRRWRTAIGQTPEILEMSLTSRGMHFGDDISLQLSHTNPEILERAVKDTMEYLEGFTGVVDISNSEKAGKKEMRFYLSNQARSLGITPQAFAGSLRSAFYGIEVVSLLRDKQEVKVQLRYPKEFREDLTNLERLRIRSPQGGEITLAEAAHWQESTEPLSIRRVERERVNVVTAKIETSVKNPDAITEQVKEQWMSELARRYPELKVTQTGADKERAKSMKSLIMSFVAALFFIYALLAIFFRSYNQPLVVMLAIPFGIAGAVLGHLVLGYPLSFMSLFGLVGLSGVVVNDSLILIDTVNQHPSREEDLWHALVRSAQTRLRPIVMTSITTFLGLMPMLLETSRQAQFMVPMAISLGVGIMFATVITLILVPAFYLIELDLREGQPLRRFIHGIRGFVARRREARITPPSES